MTGNSWLAANASLIGVVLLLMVLALTGAVVWLAGRVRRLEAGYRLLTAGTDGGNLEEVLNEHMHNVRAATVRVDELDALVHDLARDGRMHIQRLGFLRFNPFRDAGGDQSFVLALADQDGNGVVVSSLHGRDGTRVYAKPLSTWQSPYQLGDEEQTAIQQAKEES